MKPPYDDDENDDDDLSRYETGETVDDTELDEFDRWIREHAYWTIDQMMIEKYRGK